MHPGSVRRMLMRREGPPHVKVGGRLYFPRELTEQWLDSRLRRGQGA